METTVTWIVAILFSLIGWGSLFHFAWIQRNWPEVNGRVVGNLEEYAKGSNINTGGKRIVNFAKIEFFALGKRYEVRGGVGRGQPWRVGDSLSLRYKPSNPEHMLDLNFWQRMMFSGAFIGFGGACAAILAGYIS